MHFLKEKRIAVVGHMSYIKLQRFQCWMYINSVDILLYTDVKEICRTNQLILIIEHRWKCDYHAIEDRSKLLLTWILFSVFNCKYEYNTCFSFTSLSQGPISESGKNGDA